LGEKSEKLTEELELKNQHLEAALTENEAVRNQLRSVLESLDSAVVMIDPQFRVLLFNPAAEKVYGVSADKVLGEDYAKIFGESAGDHLPLIDTLERGLHLSGHEKYWKVGSHQKPIGYTTCVVRDAQGKGLGAVEISTDLTEIKRLQAQMQHAQVLAAMGEMAATVAHEIRNPLAGIGGFAGLLERDLALDDPRRTLVRKIVQGVASLNKIVSNLLVYTRPMEMQPQRVNLVEWMEDILRYAEIEIQAGGKDISIARDYGFGKLEGVIDPEKFQQVFLNLLLNAIQAIPEKGTVTVSAHLDGQSFLRIGVQDSGTGIPPEALDKIFNPFFTTKEQGTGLGLAIVQRIVHLHGGTLRAESPPGGPTLFEIRIDPRGHAYA
jgi:PAS domain S-box-containing protein